MSDATFCRLPSESLPVRLAQVRGELRPDLVEARREPLELSLRYRPSQERLADILSFVAAESACCAFLRFDLRVAMEGDGLALRIQAPREAKGLLDVLERAVAG